MSKEFTLNPFASTPRISEGNHDVTITGVTETLSNAGNLQFKVDFEDADGNKLSDYYNTIGYAKNADKTYKLDSRGKKVITKEASAEVQKILGKLMFHAGLDTEQAVHPRAMIGNSVGIIVENELATEGASEGSYFPRVQTTFIAGNPPAPKAKATADSAF